MRRTRTLGIGAYALVAIIGCGETTDDISRRADGSSPGSPLPGDHGDPPPASGNDGGGSPDPANGGGSALPRLSHAQWENTVRDLLRLDARPLLAGNFTHDPPSVSTFDNHGGHLEVTPGLWGDYMEAAEALARTVVEDADAFARMLPAELPDNPEAQARAFIEDVGLRGFRRPLSEEELSDFLELYRQAPSVFPQLGTLEAGARLVIQALLQSPYFVYRPEVGQQGPDGSTVLNDFELASRLSYALWDSMPDAHLLDAAAQGDLGDPGVLARHAERMLENSRTAAKIAAFHDQLYELDTYDHLELPGLSAEVGSAMREETTRFVRDVLLDNAGGLRALLTSPFTYVNAELAQLYGIEGDFGNEFVRVALDPTERAGLLTQTGFLSAHAGDAAPILRGVFVNAKILCSELPPPPVFEPPELRGNTTRERVESITGPGTCGEGCHTHFINPAGFPFETFDRFGRFRTEEDGFPIDATASLPFQDGIEHYDGPVEFSARVAASREAHECYARHWLEFAYGRPYGAGDRTLVESLGDASLSLDLPIKDILYDLALHPNFRTRTTQE